MTTHDLHHDDGFPDRSALEQRIAELEHQVRELLRHQEEANLAKERFRLTVDNAPIGMAIVGLEGLFIRVNHALSELFGYAPDELVRLRFQDITHPDDLAIDLSLLEQTISGEISRYQLAKRYIRKDGSLVHTVLHVALVRDDFGKPVHFISQILDVTETKRKEEALRASEELFRLLSTRLPVGVFQSTPGGDCVFVNERWCELMGLSSDEAMGPGWRATIHPDDAPRVIAAWQHQSGKDELTLEHRVLTPGGIIRWVQTTSAPLTTAEGQIKAYLGAVIDIQDRKHIEDLLRESLAQKEIIAAQKTKLAELSTPLIPIREDILVMPLVGAIEPERAEQVLETLLAGISSARARVAILDITGVLTVDTLVAGALVRAAQAVRMLGAQMVLSGIRPEVARILVGLGAELTGIVTCANLQAAISYGLKLARD